MEVKSVQEAKDEIEQLKKDHKKIAKATHNITAWRIEKDHSFVQDSNDDGEAAAGDRPPGSASPRIENGIAYCKDYSRNTQSAIQHVLYLHGILKTSMDSKSVALGPSSFIRNRNSSLQKLIGLALILQSLLSLAEPPLLVLFGKRTTPDKGVRGAEMFETILQSAVGERTGRLSPGCIAGVSSTNSLVIGLQKCGGLCIEMVWRYTARTS
ncbi:hypothetical protein TRICI_000994 [Trichomonascus ciferrii]|uniref:Impact N-terminal domain-containing protein n=1 Tax=Trichomonascus ciferrii TaxID=44093 RepID=A0A642VCP4_9ASCO|nr:hypothetical protein TRICI_000994 [Trichomonascus ciferrii]